MNGSPELIFGEALAFYEMLQRENQLLVIYHRLINQQQIYGAWNGTWAQNLSVLLVKSITNKIGIWQYNTSRPVWLLRKHPGLAMLSAAETEEVPDDNNDEDENINE